jgi:hypothetical protein
MKQAMLAAVALAAQLALSAAYGQATDTHNPAEKGEGGHAPGLGEIMSLQQMRHSKLWFAGNARNWDLTGYECDELKEGFEDAAKLVPMVNDVSVAQVIDRINAGELTDLEKAIQAHDFGKFTSAFDRLTAACNACHQTTKHAFIVIQRPTTLPYSNQSFSPVRQRTAPDHHR